jgi:hypothetical protein
MADASQRRREHHHLRALRSAAEARVAPAATPPPANPFPLSSGPRRAPLSLFFAGVILAVLFGAPPAPAGTPIPYSCRLFHEEEHKCAFGACDKRVLERLRKECLRDGGTP